MVKPLWTLAAALLAFAAIVILLRTEIVPRGVIGVLAVCLWAVFRWISLRSSKADKARRQEELDRLKRTPTLHLDD